MENTKYKAGGENIKIQQNEQPWLGKKDAIISLASFKLNTNGEKSTNLKVNVHLPISSAMN